MLTAIRIKAFGKVLESTDAKLIRETISSSKCTKCWDCANGYPSKCAKIADIEKENIAEAYPFVKRGFQLLDENGDDSIITVTACANYCPADSKKQMSTTERNKIMDGILMEWYGTDDVNDARRTLRKNLAKHR